MPASVAALVDDARAVAAGALPADPPTVDEPVLRALTVPDTALRALGEAATTAPVSLRVTGGAGALGPALEHAVRVVGERLLAVSIALRDEDDLGRNAERIVRVLDGELPDDVLASVEVPAPPTGRPTPTWLDAVDRLGAEGHGVAFRPAPGDPVATVAVVDAALDRECPVHLAGDTSLDLTLGALAAVRVLWDGGGRDEAVRMLAEPGSAGADVRGWDDAAGASARRWLRAVESTDPAALVTALRAVLTV
ncbi:hypothetical protein [Solicola sp. PLA-1-18]|uniref:hypothetical protein n=1 Tax=Solicola sp. PLA-1-18 TaxID=3380532 RepID=UPI003B7E836D